MWLRGAPGDSPSSSAFHDLNNESEGFTPLQSPGQRAPPQALLLLNPMLALCPILAHFPPLQSTPTWKKATPTCNKLFPTPRTFTLLGELAFVSRYFETGHTRLSAFDLTPDDPCQPQICYGLKSGFHSVLVLIINVYERLQICHTQLGASVHLTLGELYQAVQQFSDCQRQGSGVPLVYATSDE